MEKIKKPLSGFLALLIALLCLGVSFYCLINIASGGWMVALAIIGFV